MEEENKVRIEIPTEKYVKAKAASGAVSRHNGDVVAASLEGLTIDEVYALASEVTEVSVGDLHAKYGHLNVGQQRMNLGNRVRGVVGKMNRACDKAADAKVDAPHVTGDEYLTQLAEPFRDAVAYRAEAEAKAKAERDAERAAKAEAKAAAKATKAEAVEDETSVA